MSDRSFNETDLRQMLEVAGSYRPDVAPGRWIISTRHTHRAWEVVVEPDVAQQALIVVTAYPIG